MMRLQNLERAYIGLLETSAPRIQSCIRPPVTARQRRGFNVRAQNLNGKIVRFHEVREQPSESTEPYNGKQPRPKPQFSPRSRPDLHGPSEYLDRERPKASRKGGSFEHSTRSSDHPRTPHQKPPHLSPPYKERLTEFPQKSNREGRIPSRSRRTTRDDHIPLEGATTGRGLIPGLEKLDSGESTMTPAELYIFDKLLNLRKSPQPTSSTPKKSESSQNPPTIQTAAESVQLSDAAKRNIERINTLFQQAETDIDLWDILTQKVMTKLMDLDLDSASPSHLQKLQNRWNLTKSSPSQKPPAASKAIVTAETLPQHLVNFIYTAQQHFPHSDIGLNILPMLRDIGPSASALGARTTLYNAHIYLLTHKYFDLDAAMAELEDMNRNVFVYNSGTEGIVRWQLKEVEAMRSGKRGEGLRAWAQMEVSKEKAAELKVMERRVREVRFESILRKAESERVDLET